MKLLKFPWTLSFRFLMKDLIDWICRHAVWYRPGGEGRGVILFSLHAGTHANICVHTLPLKWMSPFIGNTSSVGLLGLEPSHAISTCQSCTYQKNVSPAVPVSLFHINVSLTISTVHRPNPDGLSHPWKWAEGAFLPVVTDAGTHHLPKRQAVFPAGMTAGRRTDIPWGSPFRDFSESLSLGGLASPLPAGANGLSPTGS